MRIKDMITQREFRDILITTRASTFIRLRVQGAR